MESGRISIVPYTPEWEAAVNRFNTRMRQGNASADFGLPARSPRQDARTRDVVFLLAIDDSEVRGGMILQEHRGFIRSLGTLAEGTDVLVGNLQSPLSEGIINPQFAGVALRLIRHALRRTPYLYAVGMGSEANPFARFLIAAGWTSRRVPFFFRVLNAPTFVRELRPLQRDVVRRSVAWAASVTGVASLIFTVLQRSRTPASDFSTMIVSAETGHSPSDDDIWRVAEPRCSFAVRRDNSMLAKYLQERVVRLNVLKHGMPVGWFSLLETQMHNDRYFGNMRVATLIDMIALNATDLPAFAQLATGYASDRSCDVVISNQLMLEARQALRESGFVPYGSNFLAITSPKLSAAMIDETSLITRQDGDGLTHL